MGRGGGKVVSVLIYSGVPGLNPVEVYNYSVKLLLKRTKINKKRPVGSKSYLYLIATACYFKKVTISYVTSQSGTFKRCHISIGKSSHMKMCSICQIMTESFLSLFDASPISTAMRRRRRRGLNSNSKRN